MLTLTLFIIIITFYAVLMIGAVVFITKMLCDWTDRVQHEREARRQDDEYKRISN